MDEEMKCIAGIFGGSLFYVLIAGGLLNIYWTRAVADFR